jgi:hypothetical protein
MSGDNAKAGYTPLAQGACSGVGAAAAVVVAVADGVVPAPAAATTATDRVEVVAPADLPGGYELPCHFLGRPVVVRVVSSTLNGIS